MVVGWDGFGWPWCFDAFGGVGVTFVALFWVGVEHRGGGFGWLLSILPYT